MLFYIMGLRAPFSANPNDIVVDDDDDDNYNNNNNNNNNNDDDNKKEKNLYYKTAIKILFTINLLLQKI